jgi:hypothetical protein
VTRIDIRPEHVPLGDPCRRCNLPASMHRLRPFRTRIRKEHFSIGDPCKKCGFPASIHYPRTRQGRFCPPEHEAIGNPCLKCGLAVELHKPRTKKKVKDESYDESVFVGIDGEGQGRERHKYVMLAASDNAREFARYISNPGGLPTVECLDFILSFPNRIRFFAYSFGYDLTMMLKDLPNEHLYYLFRPELRKRRKNPELGPIPILWNEYSLNLQGTRFTVAKDDVSRTIWDIWKFYQCRFTKALEQWNIGNEEREYLEKMKMQRGEFDKLTLQEILPYCFTECRHLATLAERLVNAHNDAGLKLRTFYGAGSTGGAILKQMNVRRCMADPPKELEKIVPFSFFGGRFEISMMGLVPYEDSSAAVILPKKVYSRDISSAYPYQSFRLPCLKHAKWEHITERKDLVTMTKGTALVRYKLHAPTTKKLWGPFPFRLTDGSICFPESSGGGWIWGEEFLAGEAIFPNVEFVEAWNLYRGCECRPFEKIAHYYLERLRIGKEGAGWVFKLGPNATYGKLAQSVGDGPFTNWIWASLITSGTRAQMLRAMGLHKNIDNVLMIATDGMHTLEDISSEAPEDTGTFHVSKPLGGWEVKEIDGGVFYARPGVYFSLTADSESVRGRGLGRNTLYDNRANIMAAWERSKEANQLRDWSAESAGEDSSSSVLIGNVVRFLGAKTCITLKQGQFFRSLDYGQWRKRPIELSFSPLPKRASINADSRLELRKIPQSQQSQPYKKALSEDSIIPILRKHEIEEQPDLTIGVYQ